MWRSGSFDKYKEVKGNHMTMRLLIEIIAFIIGIVMDVLGERYLKVRTAIIGMALTILAGFCISMEIFVLYITSYS